MKNMDDLGKGPYKPIPEQYSTNKKMAETIMEMHKGLYVANPKTELMPGVFLVCQNGDIAPIVTGFGPDADKDYFAFFLRVKMKEWNVVRYAFFSEAWVADASSNIMPSKREDRKEITMVCVEDKTSPPHAVMLEIVRDWEDGTVTGFKPLDLQVSMSDAGVTFGGRFSGLLR